MTLTEISAVVIFAVTIIKLALNAVLYIAFKGTLSTRWSKVLAWSNCTWYAIFIISTITLIISACLE